MITVSNNFNKTRNEGFYNYPLYQKNINAFLKDILDLNIEDLIDVNELCLQYLRGVNQEIYLFLKTTEDLEELRDKMYSYLEKQERRLFSADNNLPVLEKDMIRESIKVFRNIIAPVNERRTETSITFRKNPYI